MPQAQSPDPAGPLERPSRPALPESRSARRSFLLSAVAAGILAEAILAFGYGTYLLVESIVNPTETPQIGLTVAGFALAGAALVALVARGLARNRRSSRAPAVLIQLLLLFAVGIPLTQAGQYVVGVAMMLVAAVALVLLFTAPN